MVIPAATSRERVVRTGTSRVSTSTFTPAASARLTRSKPIACSLRAAAIKLEPQYVGRDLGRALDRHAADEAKRIGHVRALRRRGEILVGAGKDQRRPAHRGDAERRGIAAAEQLDVDRRQGRGDAITRHQFDRVERIPVARDAAVGARRRRRNIRRRSAAGSGAPSHADKHRRETAMQRDKARVVVGRIALRGGGRLIKAVVSCMACPSLCARPYRADGGCSQWLRND